MLAVAKDATLMEDVLTKEVLDALEEVSGALNRRILKRVAVTK